MSKTGVPSRGHPSIRLSIKGTSKNAPVNDGLAMDADVLWFRRGFVGAGGTFLASCRLGGWVDGLLLSCGSGALQKYQSADVVGEVLKPDLNLRPHDADRADESTAGCILLRPEHMLDTGAHLALAVV